MMKGRASTTMILSLGFLALYSIHQISLSGDITKAQVLINSSSISLSSVICDRTHYFYDICSINGPTVMDPTISTFHVVGPTPTIPMQKLRPYPRKFESPVMSKIKELSLLTLPPPNAAPPCHIHHHAPALVFSTGGYTGNLFHDFNDGLIPLFITTRHLLSGHRDRDLVLVIADSHDWWLTKYAELLRGLTRHAIINLDSGTSLQYCFPSATVGLISHGFSTINPSLMPNSESLANFRAFIDRSYAESGLSSLPPPRPRLVLVARNRTAGRVLLNQADVVREAEAVGFEVTVFSPSRSTSLREAYRLINRSHVLVGVHGAALTHMYFLPPGAVLIQVVQLGLESVADLCFGEPARQLGLEYMEYKIRVEESSLLEKYDRNDKVLKNPSVVTNKGWSYIKNTYLQNQDVRLDLAEFTKYLKKAYKKAKRLMNLEGNKG